MAGRLGLCGPTRKCVQGWELGDDGGGPMELRAALTFQQHLTAWHTVGAQMIDDGGFYAIGCEGTKAPFHCVWD